MHASTHVLCVQSKIEIRLIISIYCRAGFMRVWPVLSLTLCYCRREILNNYILELVLCKWRPMGHVHAQRRYMQFGRLQFLPPHLHKVFPVLREHRIRPESRVLPGDWKRASGRRAASLTEQVGMLAAVRGHAFHFNQNLLLMLKEDNDPLRNMNDQETLWYSFLLMLLLSISQSLCWKLWHWRKGKNRATTHSSFFFQFFCTHQ